VYAAEIAQPISLTEAEPLFYPLAHARALVLAVSGGPDSTALLILAAGWRRGHKGGPKLFAATVDHGLRPQSKREARAVSRLARALRVPHHTLPWRGKKPVTGIQEAARAARYRLLTEFAQSVGADQILTAHTLDDQAETVLMRMCRGSGMTGLGGMLKVTPLSAILHSRCNTRRTPKSGDVFLVRPLIDIPKARLIATLEREKVAFSEDDSNRDLRFARARLREMMGVLAGEGLDARRLAAFARRLRRADAALETAADMAARTISRWPWSVEGPITFDRYGFLKIPAELGLRLLGRAVGHVGDEGPVELAKLERLYENLAMGSRAVDGGLRSTLAGAVISVGEKDLTVERAPPRRRQRAPHSLNHSSREAPTTARNSAATKRKIKKKGDSAPRRLAEGRLALRLYRGRMRLAPARHRNRLAAHRRP
jgi:tRNA(Ile)-lysidine synthase